MNTDALFVAALLIFGYSVLAGRLARWAITAPIVFTIAGWLLGPSVTGGVDLRLDDTFIEGLAEVTLVLVLFADATRIDLAMVRQQFGIPARLLGLGLPLAVVLGGLVARARFPDLGWAEAFLIAAIVAPTDAALGQAVVSDHRVPVRVRQALNVESGLNDGLALPLVAGLAAAAAGVSGSAGGVGEAAVDLVFGLAVGGAVGVAGGWTVRTASERLDLQGTPRQLATLAVPAIAYGITHVTAGNGFIAAFAAGLAFGTVARDVCEGAQDFTEDEGQLLTWVTFFVFGAVMVGPALETVRWQTVAYALLSLVVIRVAAVGLASLGLGLQRVTIGFLGWFGPRGLASILFGFLVLDESVPSATLVLEVVTITVALSVLLHGFTAAPLAARYGRWSEAMEEGPEMEEVDEMRVARRGGVSPTWSGWRRNRRPDR